MITIDVGFITLTLENFEIWEKLSNKELIDQTINQTNELIGKDICLVIDEIYGVDGGNVAYYDLDTEQKAVFISKPSESDKPWWFETNRSRPDDMLAFILSVDEATRISVANKLKVNYPNSIIPVKDMADELWWFQAQKPIGGLPIGDTSQMQLKKIVDNIIVNHYTTFIGRVVSGD